MGAKKQKDTSENWTHKHDYPIEEVWCTYKAIARLIVPRLQAFKALDKNGGLEDFTDIRQWINTIQKIIDAFELLKYDGVYSEEENRAIEYGLDLFRKYYRYLWD